MASLTPAARERLEETLRLWLLHRGRREPVAEALFVHPQTVRYRVGQLRELFGDTLDDPGVVADLVVALGVPPAPAPTAPAATSAS
jgi:DNA-binding PucR family transcriptional regulator